MSSSSPASTALFLNTLIIHIVLAGGLPSRLLSSLLATSLGSRGLPEGACIPYPAASVIPSPERYVHSPIPPPWLHIQQYLEWSPEQGSHNVYAAMVAWANQ
ncbi:hypothetical protein LXA43DRAFT_1052980, partial [Ganoderma leucocontextum]